MIRSRKGIEMLVNLSNISYCAMEYLNTVPGLFEFVFIPTHGSWLNMVEGFFSKMTRQMLMGIRVDSKEELKEHIYKYFNKVNTIKFSNS